MNDAVRRARATWFLFPFAAAGACQTPSAAGTASDGGAAPDANLADAQLSCRDNSACATGEYCGYEPGLCGKGMRAGTCRPKPVTCQDGYSPVCGCDGKIYDNECAAHAESVDLAVMGGCRALVPDRAACGRRYCDVRTSYCEIYLSDVFELPTSYSCKPLPPACVEGDGARRTCDCFPPGTPCLTFCGPLQTGGLEGFHLTCQGVKEPVP